MFLRGWICFCVVSAAPAPIYGSRCRGAAGRFIVACVFFAEHAAHVCRGGCVWAGLWLLQSGMALLVADRSRMADEVPRMLSLHLALNGFGQFFTVYILKGLRTVLGYGSIEYDWLGAGVLILALCFAYVLLDHRLECVSKCRKMQFLVDLPAFQGDFPQA